MSSLWSLWYCAAKSPPSMPSNLPCLKANKLMFAESIFTRDSKFCLLFFHQSAPTTQRHLSRWCFPLWENTFTVFTSLLYVFEWFFCTGLIIGTSKPFLELSVKLLSMATRGSAFSFRMVVWMGVNYFELMDDWVSLLLYAKSEVNVLLSVWLYVKEIFTFVMNTNKNKWHCKHVVFTK